MSDNFVRHLISFIGMLVAVMAYAAGYISGLHSWWWTALALIGVYVAIYKLVNV